jgi:hypothetical protein
MKLRTIFTVVSIFIFLFAFSATSEETTGKIPRLFGTFSPQNGAWSEYAVFDKTTGERILMRIAIVGMEGNSHWYEVANEGQKDRNIVKMLVKGDPYDNENIQRLILKTGDKPAQEMPLDFVMMGRKMANHMFEQRSGIPIQTGIQLKNEVIGKGHLVVPAGEFPITKHQIIDDKGIVYARYTFSNDVFPLGVVSSETEKSSMVLLDYGTNAVSAITEDPEKMSLPPGMPEGLPRGMPPGFNMPNEEMQKQYMDK